MILKAYSKKETTPQDGDERRVIRYAWFPKKVLMPNGKRALKIWLESYDEVYRWQNKDRYVPQFKWIPAMRFKAFAWDLIRLEARRGVPKMSNPPPPPPRCEPKSIASISEN